MKTIVLCIACAALHTSCNLPTNDDLILKNALASNHPKIKNVMQNLTHHEVQIKYTQINRVNDSLIFTDYDFQVNDSVYFYPASTVKFPIAVVALEKIFKTDSLSVHTRYYVEGDTVESTVAKDISQIFAVSDNLANNRLFELLGQDFATNQLLKKGLSPVRISHRLAYHTENLQTKPWVIYVNDSTTTMSKPSQNTWPAALLLKNILKGKGFYEDDKYIAKPFDFSLKNYYPISTQHDLLKRVIFPDEFIKKEQFNLDEAHRALLLSAMRTTPRNAGYNPNTYPDGYCKFFMFGDTKENIPSHIEIYNKVGYAYGTLTDCAYIKDTRNNIDFFLTATILVNKNGIYNDDVYEYETVGIPFLAQLGREIYQQELNRH